MYVSDVIVKCARKLYVSDVPEKLPGADSDQSPLAFPIISCHYLFINFLPPPAWFLQGKFLSGFLAFLWKIIRYSISSLTGVLKRASGWKILHFSSKDLSKYRIQLFPGVKSTRNSYYFITGPFPKNLIYWIWGVLRKKIHVCILKIQYLHAYNLISATQF